MKKALLIISFGTSYPQTREKNIDACEQHLAAACGDRDLFRAFTSEMIIRKLHNRDGLQIDNPGQALNRLAEAGYQDVAVQSLHVINGDEFEKVVREVHAFRNRFQRLALGAPLLSGFDDYPRLMTALRGQMPTLAADERVVFMGHGASHPAFSAYACLDHLMASQNFPALVGAVESYPEIDHIIARLQQQRVRKVHLMPLMLVAGDHAINDMASDEADSWKSRLEAVGIDTQSWLRGLGENPLIRQMFAQHLEAALRLQEQEAA
ncbi:MULTISPECIES: sirohydrochlorin cobaltochelatase [unclassified Brenneria]|uniref:sirohydrochlorin cobaltochelatase n=1 Tax=unclassified Brenneria TaxID=2634434 RepID=UPI00155668CE|nr:sirohydrochlorin cobaltochelatase [Brenneria sp. hezel4-2-4]MEE3651027.1 sirohydrochlorin cobaltochelatase [Brenneria sp. HEZEL_4_2_4]NPD00982.1 sirohydrochlorin cobaltochelatase [Brenneria sp. hezel4-2-4]